MSAALLWVVLPLIAAVILWFLRRRESPAALVAAGLCAVLAGLAWVLPVGEILSLGPLQVRVDPELVLIGRRLVLENSDRPLLVLFYGVGAFWFGGALPAGNSRQLPSYGLGMLALLVAALAVEPFLYAALLIEMAVLISVPLLAAPGEADSRQGVLRYLIFQTLAMPFILLAGWALAGLEINPADGNLVTLSAVFLGLGFAFWLAIFPFYTWAPMLAGQAMPYPVGFVFMVLPTAVLLLGLDFINAFGWLRASPQLYLILRLAGALMVVTAGAWAAFQRNLGRLFGYAVIVETGFSLLAISLNSHLGTEMFVMFLLPRLIALGLWSLCAAIIRRSGRTLDFASLQQVAEELPAASAGLAAAYLSLAGLPLLGTFSMRFVLLQQVAVDSPLTAVWVLGGMAGLLFAGFRLLAVITGGNFGLRPFAESRIQMVLIGAGVIALLLLGFFPRLFLPLLTNLLQAFTRLP